jgi:membrane associated rhomboid family serine protease
MNDLKRHWRSGLKTICVLVILIWIVEAANSFFGHGFNTFGIYPRDVDTLPGILLWPLLHGSLKHLIMNTTPLLIMGFFVALRGPWVFTKTTLLILIIGGLGVWAFARPAYHIGSSGLIFGYFGFLVAMALYERSISSLVIASVTLFFYGGLILGVLPTDSFISWEGHLFGLTAGILAARLTVFRHKFADKPAATPSEKNGAQDV